ncbi:MAG: FG-GAP repeat domain-containing protein, partial [Planctomycetota bacterium]
DVDGDGDLDALVANTLGSPLGAQSRLYLNGGTGGFTDATATNLPAISGSAYAASLGDLDADGDLDSIFGIVGPLPGPPNLLLLNTGGGVFADATATNFPAAPPPYGTQSAALALGDVDGDGDLDAYAGNGWPPIPRQDRLYLNDGTAMFTDVTAISLPALPGSAALAIGDVDGDGDLDAFVGGVQEHLYLNDGVGIFTDLTSTNLPVLSDATSSVALADVDGDGDLDALSGNYGQDRLFVNGGTGVFADVTATNLPVFSGDTRGIGLGDVEGDGDLDAFLGTYGLGSRLYLNGGTGVFADATATNLPLLPDLTLAVALADVEGDGDLDAFTGNHGQSRQLLNAGSGAFADATATDLPPLSESTLAVAVGDLDGDGDLDVYTGVVGQDRIYTNLSRQLAWRGIPRAGKPLTLDVRGPASGTWLLAASAGSASLPLPPFGTLRLLPSTLFIVAGGVLDPQGRADVSFLVPANPALVGLSFYWQAVVGPPPRFTNLEVTTVTNL